LKNLHKKEIKGARRELKKDNIFIANEKARVRKEKDSGFHFLNFLNFNYFFFVKQQILFNFFLFF